MRHSNIVPSSIQSTLALEQWFPTGGSRNPRGPKQDFQGSEMRRMSLDEHFFKGTDIYENLQVLFLKKINII